MEHFPAGEIAPFYIGGHCTGSGEEGRCRRQRTPAIVTSPGIVNFPVFLTSVMPIFARASRAFEHSDFFRSIDFAIESAMPVFGIAITSWVIGLVSSRLFGAVSLHRSRVRTSTVESDSPREKELFEDISFDRDRILGVLVHEGPSCLLTRSRVIAQAAS